MQPDLGIDPNSTDSGEVSWTLGFSFFSSNIRHDDDHMLLEGAPGKSLGPLTRGCQCSLPSERDCCCLLNIQAVVMLACLGSAQSPHPWERAPGAALPPILTSASVLYQHHTMGLGPLPPARHPQPLHCWEMGSSFHCWEGAIFGRDQPMPITLT